MNHTPSHIYSKSRLNGPEVGIKVAGNSPVAGDGSAPVINAAEGSTVIYAAPNSTIGHLAGLRPSGFRAEGGGMGLLDMTLGDVLRSEWFWAATAIGLGIALMARRDRS